MRTNNVSKDRNIGRIFGVYATSLMLFSALGCSSVIFDKKTIRNTDCLESNKIKVLQILDDGFLGFLCPVDYPSYYDDAFEACISKGDVVFMAVDKSSNNFVDNQKISLESDTCFVGDGTYQYLNKENTRKTVRKIKTDASRVPNPDYKE